MKKRVSIYIDEDVWERAKNLAWSERKSASCLVEEVLKNIKTADLVEPKYEHKDLVAEIPVEEIKEDFINALADAGC